MPYRITGKDIRKQLVGHYSSYIAVLVIIAVILGFCTVFCGTELEWTHPFSIIGIAAFSIVFILILIMIIKMINLSNHYVFKRYGSADNIAESINQGLKNNRYVSKYRTNPSALVITDKFIVSTSNYKYYLELSNARCMQRRVVGEIKPIVMTGNPITTAAATVGVNHVRQKYSNSPNFDFLIIWDDKDVRHEYSIRSDEIVDVMKLLSEIAPQIEIKETRPL